MEKSNSNTPLVVYTVLSSNQNVHPTSHYGNHMTGISSVTHDFIGKFSEMKLLQKVMEDIY